MALIIPSAIISEIRGKVGGSVFQRSRSGIILRANTTPVNKNSNLQNTARAVSFNVLQEWTRLTDAQRSSWDRFVQYLPIQQKNIKVLYITGQQAFIKFNSYRLHYSLSILTTPRFNKCALTPITLNVTSNGAVMWAAANRALVSANEFIVLFITVIFPSSVNNPGARYKLVKFVTTDTDQFNITSYYTGLFGRIAQPGETLFIKYTNVSKLSGYPFPFSFKKITL